MKRIVAGLLWSLVVMWIGSYGALFLGVTAAITLPFGVATAAYVIIDPAGLFWGKRFARENSTPTAEATTSRSPGLAHQL